MSEFRSMTIVAMRGNDFRTVVLEDHHDVSVVERVQGAADIAGYEIVSVVVDGWDFEEEMWPHIDHASNIPAFFEAVKNDPHNVDVICAWLTVNDAADVENWEDSIHLSGQDSEAVVREWASIFHKVYEETGSLGYSSEYVKTDPFPSWMEIDWEETLEGIARDNSSSVVEFHGLTYYFGE